LVEARIGLALALRDLGRDDEARDQGRQLVQDQPESTAVLIFEGERCAESGDIRAAVAAFRKAIALQSSNADAHYQLGCVLMRQLKADEAIASFQTAIAIDPSHFRARWTLVMAQIPTAMRGSRRGAEIPVELRTHAGRARQVVRRREER
jgi:tetratricopeptide (TPR) repeat protein